jgi:hypothetical protein
VTNTQRIQPSLSLRNGSSEVIAMADDPTDPDDPKVVNIKNHKSKSKPNTGVWWRVNDKGETAALRPTGDHARFGGTTPLAP